MVSMYSALETEKRIFVAFEMPDLEPQGPQLFDRREALNLDVGDVSDPKARVLTQQPRALLCVPANRANR